MDSRLEDKKIREYKKMKKKKLTELCGNLAVEHESLQEKIEKLEVSKSALKKILFDAIDKAETKKVETTRSKMDVLNNEIERLTKRKKSVAEELELIRRAEKNDYDGKANVWKTVGAWVIGISTTVISGWGIVKSHSSFEDGSMVDKATKSAAEKASGISRFFEFLRKN